MRAEQAFMALLRAGLYDTTPSADSFTGLTARDWQEVYDMTRRQTVSGICYAALCRLPDSMLPDDRLLTHWVARVNAIEKANADMTLSTVRLIGIMQSHGLHPVLQKGLSVARHYPSPSLREAGDIDLWFAEDEIKEAVNIARTIDSNLQSHPDQSYSFEFEGFVVEIHRKLINLGNPAATAGLKRLIATEPVQTIETAAGPLPVLSPLLEMLLIDVHIMRHSFGMGIGLRQICDYAMAASRLRGLYSDTAFAEACRTFGIQRWTSMLNRFVAENLGTPADLLPDSGFDGNRPVSPQRLLEIVKEGGNFGHYLPPKRSIFGRKAQSKLHTLSLIIKRSHFAATMAPREALWSFLRLILGQVH